MRRGTTLLVALAAIACALAPSAAARSYKSYWFRISNVAVKGTSTLAGTTTDEYGITTSGSATRTATMDYHGRRGDLAEYIELPRHGFHGNIQVNHLVRVSVKQSGSWTTSSTQGSRTTNCNGSGRTAGEQPESGIFRTGTQLHGSFAAPSSVVDFGDDCQLTPVFASADLKWSSRMSAFHRRVVKLSLKHDEGRAGDIRSTMSWRGTVTLTRLRVCRTIACTSGIR
jgi:hypothetical protein